MKRTPAQKWAARSVAGALYTIDGEQAVIVAYAHPDLAGAAAGHIGPDGSRFGDVHVEWGGKPHFFLREALLVLYVGSNESVLAGLKEALGPQIAGR